MGETKDVCGVITDLQRFSMHDGPGIRTTIFLKGCPLHCLWCHNPETQQVLPQVQLHCNRCLLCGACAEVCLQGCHQMGERHLFDSSQCVGCLACTEACMPRALEVCGKEVTVEQVLREVEKDRAFYGSTGGMTLSGGEPMGQPDFALALLEGAK
ncbi:MAG: glycyl-radical enzyme activating protein, partial [Clostridiales bacterium]|nr:glycyl-radical enzyme activating protein [Clostridiales bacterium]